MWMPPLTTGTVEEAELDPEYHQKVDESEIDNADKTLLGFKHAPSFENAFFILTEDKEKLADLLYVHASVNLLNSFIVEICS